jgi:hypothetical protein
VASNLLEETPSEELCHLLPFLSSLWVLEAFEAPYLKAVEKFEHSATEEHIIAFWAGRLFHRNTRLRKIATEKLAAFYILSAEESFMLMDSLVPSAVYVSGLSTNRPPSISASKLSEKSILETLQKNRSDGDKHPVKLLNDIVATIENAGKCD